MRDSDPQSVTPTNEPVTSKDIEEERPVRPLPYLLGLGVIVAVLGAWGLMKMQDMRKTDVEGGSYVVQDFDQAESQKPVETFDLPVAGQPSKAVKVTMVREPSEEEVAAVDLTKSQEDRAEDTRIRRGRTLETHGSEFVGPRTETSPKPILKPEPRPVAVVDLDYSKKKLQPLDEKQLSATLTDLETRLSEVRPLAEQAEENEDFAILSGRLAELVGLHQSKASPLSLDDRREMTCHATELRDEIVVFSADLKRAMALK